MRFREHRGSLADSLETTQNVDSRDDLVAIIRAELSKWHVDVRDSAVHIKPYGGDDERCGWHDVHIVTLDGYGVVGFVEGPLT